MSGSGGLAYAHVDEEDDALLALDAGVGHLAHPVFGGPPAPPAVARIAAEATATHTTLGAFSGTLELLDGTLPIDHETIDPRVTAAWQWVRSNPDAVDPEWILGSELWTAEATATLGLLDDAGALLLPASDAGYYYVPHGLGLHLELERLEVRGFDRAALLAAATAEAAAAHRRERRHAEHHDRDVPAQASQRARAARPLSVPCVPRPEPVLRLPALRHEAPLVRRGAG